ncbi:tRNA (adenosine(37)-N6)-dimethylallyltransferase MiaA [Rickettsia typhi]|uniref:tRNA dimethylallyltransferase n=2 Tax=Rickettsia typhi TaxID=785 RepID=MIAA_RICTY|nr:tRNA (adenosine(37)-N6)-dimethylallyltransferase MiaA [Rickettsia typhi]Q68WM5.1 RecName: Full=tRNA dimethylallyltransferase; AltName: Full=Dimethylallyl diphosphate:tRNA dimethylallyltransferase; Short=DMAPP:tRNA dimethylallyltransferase; Short=DMATase; AltName: Full=Isopentenyl-diphosphate:tRNA isopentenyltransferase; Short=IPP transferase; Short=IPPT; Short=IPTase [Rickettsia typhi str. Wilmington]AAU03967.1 IPP transferase [Rickettsia typhi str. Wilmington]AFE54348.1 tRNA delta(2)-isopent
MIKKEIIILCGPTASGKSYLGHELAKAYGCEIINIDSMQVYREIPIITASPIQIYNTGIHYHLYNFLSITEDFSVIKYLKLASEKIREITARGKIPILIGGTGLYINLLVFGYNNIPDISQDVRVQVRNLHNEIGNIELWNKLEKLDPIAATKINHCDTQRLIRAYEVLMHTGKSIFSFHTAQKERILSDFNFKIIFLNPERKFLYKTCDERLDKIFKDKAIDEIALIKKQFTPKEYANLKAVGIKEIIAYLDGNLTLNDALNVAQMRTRQYAKRQVTWFTHQIQDKTILEYSTQEEFEQILRNLLFTLKS